MIETSQTDFDAIVIGSGISGGYTAMELCQKGYKTLVLERGRSVEHGDYPTAHDDMWDLPHRNNVPREEIEEHYPQQSRLGWWVRQENKHWVNKDSDYSYDEDERFDWIRGHHTGGKSIMWGRHCYRFSDIDFEANKKEGIAIDWPIRYDDIEPWYDRVETFVGIAGQAEGLKQVPDGKFLKPFPLNCAEQHLREAVAETFPGRVVTPGRVANLSEYKPEVHKGKRGQCLNRNRCIRGCPYGAYFSSQAATLPVAEETGNLTLRNNSIVQEIVYDPETKRAKSVRVIDSETGEHHEYSARIIFCNAGTIGTTAILLNSRSETFPNGLGNTSGELGHNMMDHHYGMGAQGVLTSMDDQYYSGRKPVGFYIPRFMNLDDETRTEDYLRGFSYQGSAIRLNNNPAGVNGEALKEVVFQPGPWLIRMTCFGEILPYHENRMYLNFNKRDQWGIPTIVFDAKLRDNEIKMREDGVRQAAKMLEAAGCVNVSTRNEATAVGACIHEMGTARMGHDPATSVLNQWNQMHDVPNVFVTDGACMTSAGTQNPSITYMALTARAVDYAHKRMSEGQL
ncbi:GMC oxidoreductase [Marinimicrobium alkaliphilum]|uniref:GMC oxidoreductase n=1 Tax=Marinimicrobium alkaliphilum TaxID=2202654 RepID=UPI000DB90A6C|nr:GMC family oxidoreductase [Marinimicrobium alkaliphilum]